MARQICRATTSALAAGVAAVSITAMGCVEQPFGPALPGPGVVFSYPVPGQHDVPAGGRITLVFTNPIDDAVLDNGCSTNASGTVSGPACVVGPDGLIDRELSVVNEARTALQVRPASLAPGTSYDVWVDPELLQAGSVNIPSDKPLLSFHTRQDRMRAGEAAAIVTVNGQDPAGFASETATPALPFTDFGAVRVLFSEPLDPLAAVLGETVRVTRIDAGGAPEVEGALLVQDTHLVFDPDEDLEPDARYRLELLPGLLDLGGEPVPPAELLFAPRDTRTDGSRIEQVLNAQPAVGDDGYPAPSRVLGGTVNELAVSSQLIGDNALAVEDGSVRTEMGDPSRFEGVIPIVIRKGELLRSAGLSVAYGGAIPTGLDTGTIDVRFLSDATGFLIRNPYRDADQPPDDDRAPVWVLLELDAAITATDPTGNAVLNQTLLGIQVAGVAVADGRSLAIEATGTMELDLLGVARAPVHMVLRLVTDLDGVVPGDDQGPALQATYPAPGDDAFTAGDSVALTFSEAIAAAPPDAVQLTVTSGPAAGELVEVALARYGSTLTVTPAAPLPYGTSFVLEIGDGIRDVVGNPLVLSADDPTGGLGEVAFSTPVLSTNAPAAPVLLALYPGAPCAVTDGTAQALGRCVGGAPTDPLYAAATLPTERVIAADFNQPMAPASMTLGAGCDVGSVRVEVMDGAGACEAAVPGTLVRGERGLRFVPNAPWIPGQRYRLTLVAGADATCDAGEICSAGGVPLNTDPLCGTQDPGTDANACANGTGAEAGGPDVVIPFVGAAPTADTFVAAVAEPHTDVNGNGRIDPDEVERPEARATATITGVGGFVREAWFSTTGCLGPRDDVDEAIDLTASMPVSIGALQEDCAVGGEIDPVEVDRCMPVRITPQVMLGTSIEMCADAEIEGSTILAGLSTRQLVMRLVETPGEPGASDIRAAIAELPGENGPQLLARMTVLMDAPDMRIVGMTHDLRSKPVTLEVAGAVEYAADGRLQIRAVNTRDAVFQVRVAETQNPANTGFIEMTIRAGGLRLQLEGLPSKDQHVRRAVE